MKGLLKIFVLLSFITLAVLPEGGRSATISKKSSALQDNTSPTKRRFSLDDAFRSAITDSFKQRLEDLRFFSENLNDFETSEIFAATRGR